MPLCETGDYIVKCYDKYGTPQKDKTLIRKTLTESMDYGELVLENNKKIKSFSVDRRIYNSLDKDERY